MRPEQISRDCVLATVLDYYEEGSASLHHLLPDLILQDARFQKFKGLKLAFAYFESSSSYL